MLEGRPISQAPRCSPLREQRGGAIHPCPSAKSVVSSSVRSGSLKCLSEADVSAVSRRESVKSRDLTSCATPASGAICYREKFGTVSFHMLTDKIKQLVALKAKSASLEARLGKLGDKWSNDHRCNARRGEKAG